MRFAVLATTGHSCAYYHFLLDDIYFCSLSHFLPLIPFRAMLSMLLRRINQFSGYFTWNSIKTGDQGRQIGTAALSPSSPDSHHPVASMLPRTTMIVPR